MRKRSKHIYNSDILNERGIELANRGWLSEALRDFGRAIELDPGCPITKINRASVFLEQGKYQKALEDVLSAVKVAPDEPPTHYHLGLLLARWGSKLAEEALQTSIDLDPDQPDALLQLGMIYADQEDIAMAKQTFQKALDFAPKDPLIHSEFGNLLLEYDDIHLAIKHLKQASELDPQNSEFELDLAEAYIRAGFYQQAREILNQVVKLETQNLRAFYLLASIYADWNQPDLALKNLKHASKLSLSQIRELVNEDRMFDNIRHLHEFIDLFSADDP